MKMIEAAMNIVAGHEEWQREMIARNYCPRDFGLEEAEKRMVQCEQQGAACNKCWERECPGNIAGIGKEADPPIKDSGERREFATGAVRDIQAGKGRCALLPLEVAADYISLCDDPDTVLGAVNRFVGSGDEAYLKSALDVFSWQSGWDKETMVLEVSEHMEAGAAKYGERNWEKGIPAHCFVDSAVRHYLKWRRGDEDERHDRAFCWNILCLMWTLRHKPECNDLPEVEKDG